MTTGKVEPTRPTAPLRSRPDRLRDPSPLLFRRPARRDVRRRARQPARRPGRRGAGPDRPQPRPVARARQHLRAPPDRPRREQPPDDRLQLRAVRPDRRRPRRDPVRVAQEHAPQLHRAHRLLRRRRGHRRVRQPRVYRRPPELPAEPRQPEPGMDVGADFGLRQHGLRGSRHRPQRHPRVVAALLARQAPGPGRPRLDGLVERPLRQERLQRRPRGLLQDRRQRVRPACAQHVLPGLDGPLAARPRPHRRHARARVEPGPHPGRRVHPALGQERRHAGPLDRRRDALARRPRRRRR